MSQPCELKNLPAQPTLCIRATTKEEDIPQLFDHAYGAIFAHLASQGQQPASAPYAAYFNMDMQNLQMEIGFPVSQALPGAGEIVSGELPAGAYAVTIHHGPYQKLGDSYQALAEWVKASGYTATGTAYEIYLTDPTTVAPQHILTELRFPLAG